MLFDPERILAEQVGGDDVVDMGLGGAGTVEGFAKPIRTVIVYDADPEQVRVFLDPDGFDSRDFRAHSVPPPESPVFAVFSIVERREAKRQRTPGKRRVSQKHQSRSGLLISNILAKSVFRRGGREACRRPWLKYKYFMTIDKFIHKPLMYGVNTIDALAINGHQNLTHKMKSDLAGGLDICIFS